MAKKYVPSGYQIIDLDVSSGKVNNVPFDVTTEDENTLYNILNERLFSKPILLHLSTPNIDLTGFPIIEDNILHFITPSWTESITVSDSGNGNQLLWVETEN